LPQKALAARLQLFVARCCAAKAIVAQLDLVLEHAAWNRLETFAIPQHSNLFYRIHEIFQDLSEFLLQLRRARLGSTSKHEKALFVKFANLPWTEVHCYFV
jgi:hypothetical protein